MGSTHAHKSSFPANLWNTLDVSMEFPAFVKCSFFACKYHYVNIKQSGSEPRVWALQVHGIWRKKKSVGFQVIVLHTSRTRKIMYWPFTVQIFLSNIPRLSNIKHMMVCRSYTHSPSSPEFMFWSTLETIWKIFPCVFIFGGNKYDFNL